MTRVSLVPVSAVLALIPSLALASNLVPRKLGTMSITKPAFLAVEPMRAGEPSALIISSFSPFGANSVSSMPDVGSQLTNLAGAKVELLSKSITWPNEAKPIAENALNVPGLLVAGGFLVPGKATGALTLLRLDTGGQVELTKPRSGWFYHRAIWRDMNGDGKLDIITARATKPIIGRSQGELLWLEQPATGDALSGTPWAEHTLANGPDVHFRVEDLNNDGKEEIIATQFFSNTFAVLSPKGDGTYVSREIEKIKGAFDIEVADLNNDGKKDLLVTNHEAGGKGKVLAYEVPADLEKGVYVRHVLLDGIETRQGGFNQAAPGQAISFHPKTSQTSGKPLILVNGDGSQRAHVLTPNSDSSTDWSYTESILVDSKSTVGQSAIGDVDGDGFVEIFVPGYDKDVIHVFTYAP